MSRGGFIEDKLGQQQGMDLREVGWSSHARYGTCRAQWTFIACGTRGTCWMMVALRPRAWWGIWMGSVTFARSVAGVLRPTEQLVGPRQEAKAALEERERAKVRDEEPPSEARRPPGRCGAPGGGCG